MGLFGHINSNSLFLVKSPKWIVRNFPNVIRLPTDCGSSALFSPGLNSEQYGFGLPAPGSGVLRTCPADATISQSRPATGILSPGFTTVCVALAVSAGYVFCKNSSAAAPG